MLDRITVVTDALDHPEGIAWSPSGAIYAGGEAGQVYRVSIDGDVSLVGTTDGFAYGVTLDAEDRAFVCDFARAELVRVDADGAVTAITNGTSDRSMQVPNFSAFDEGGTLYVTDSGAWGAGTGVIYAVSPDGTTVVWTDAVADFPNGCCLTADGSGLLVVESRARRVAHVAIGSDGRAGSVTTVATFEGSQPDGLALAADGETLVVGCYRPDRIYVATLAGTVDVIADDPDGVILNQPTNVAFVGDDLATLAISSLGGWTISTVDAGLTGLPLRRPTLT
jgi:gluconolactonase